MDGLRPTRRTPPAVVVEKIPPASGTNQNAGFVEFMNPRISRGEKKMIKVNRIIAGRLYGGLT